jgi:hypothetical protein
VRWPGPRAGFALYVRSRAAGTASGDGRARPPRRRLLGEPDDAPADRPRGAGRGVARPAAREPRRAAAAATCARRRPARRAGGSEALFARSRATARHRQSG